MSRPDAVARAYAYFDDGGFLADLRRRVAIPSSSQEPERASVLRSYLDDEMTLRRALAGAWGVFGVQNAGEAGVEREEIGRAHV